MAVIFDGLSSTDPGATAPAGTSAGPPKAVLVATYAALAVSVVLAPTTDSLGYAAAGYALAAVLVPALGVACRGTDRRRQRSPWYIPSTPYRVFLRVALVGGFLLGIWHAWGVATELAK